MTLHEVIVVIKEATGKGKRVEVRKNKDGTYTVFEVITKKISLHA